MGVLVFERVRRLSRDAQIEEAARRTGVAVPDVRDIVEHAPGIRLGVVSDYEPARKLDALELVAFFDVVVIADDPDVRALKPSARGIQVALHRLRVVPSRAAYVGDRKDVDVAAAAGVTAVLLGVPGDAEAISINWFDVLTVLLET